MFKFTPEEDRGAGFSTSVSSLAQVQKGFVRRSRRQWVRILGRAVMNLISIGFNFVGLITKEGYYKDYLNFVNLMESVSFKLLI